MRAQGGGQLSLTTLVDLVHGHAKHLDLQGVVVDDVDTPCRTAPSTPDL
jgi:hypothetical protein